MAVAAKIPDKTVPVLIETESYSHVPSKYRMCLKCLEYLFPVTLNSEISCHKCREVPHFIHILPPKPKRKKSRKK